MMKSHAQETSKEGFNEPPNPPKSSQAGQPLSKPLSPHFEPSWLNYFRFMSQILGGERTKMPHTMQYFCYDASHLMRTTVRDPSG
jgi:hypothetical protein